MEKSRSRNANSPGDASARAEAGFARGALARQLPRLPNGRALPSLLRRWLLLSGLGALSGGPGAAQSPEQPGALPARTLVFPRDHGSHPQQRIEWWYITGHGRIGNGALARDVGFQITFFRTRVDDTQAMASRFAARQLLFAHAALTDVSGKRFWHAQRIARQGFDVASASETDTAIRLRDWSLVRRQAVYRAVVPAADFGLYLSFSETQDVLLQGSSGLSAKGPEPQQASYYYSRPQLAFDGEIQLAGQRLTVSGAGAGNATSGSARQNGAAWLDHEWSDSLLHPDAVGWDWIGINLFDGGALMAFRIRDKSGHNLWDGGSFRPPGVHGATRPHVFSKGEVLFQAVRGWKSPLTQATYPVEWLLRTPAGTHVLRAVLDNQELDSRNSTGAVYWEGLSDLFDGDNRHVGRGYLEMTGYSRALVL